MKVSVLIPAYNVEDYITQCLESVCNQTYQDLQIVVIDDGSKDSTYSIISDFAERDNRIQVKSRENRGVAQTRNELLDKATGDYVLFVDADDWIEPDMISSLIEISKKFSVGITMCRISDTTSEIKNSEIFIWEKKEFLNKFLEHRILTGSLCNKLIKRILFNCIRFNPNIGYGEDAMIMWDLLNQIDKMAYTSQAFYHYRMNDTSISHQVFSEAKMSVIPVWEYISKSEYTIKNNLEIEAKARYGVEISLLLLEALRGEIKATSKANIKILKKYLKILYPSIIRGSNISWKFKIFALIAILDLNFCQKIVR